MSIETLGQPLNPYTIARTRVSVGSFAWVEYRDGTVFNGRVVELTDTHIRLADMVEPARFVDMVAAYSDIDGVDCDEGYLFLMS